jgi:hypothetical protein
MNLNPNTAILLRAGQGCEITTATIATRWPRAETPGNRPKNTDRAVLPDRDLLIDRKTWVRPHCSALEHSAFQNAIRRLAAAGSGASRAAVA